MILKSFNQNDSCFLNHIASSLYWTFKGKWLLYLTQHSSRLVIVCTNVLITASVFPTYTLSAIAEYMIFFPQGKCTINTSDI